MWRSRPIWPGHATPADAVRYLASACDGAIRRDGHGFSSDHVALGQWLAQLSDEHWGPNENTTALQLVRFYRHQLTRVGFRPTDILRQRRPRRISRRAARELRSGWAPDPTALHEWRWWNGARWTHETTATDRRPMPKECG